MDSSEGNVHVPEGPSPRRLRKPLGCGGCLLVAFGLSVVLLVVAFFTWSIRSSRRVEAQLARIRAAGEPSTLGELEVFYQPSSSEEDTAWLWLDALRPLEGEAFQSAAGNLPIVGDGEVEIPPPGQPWPDLQAVEKLLQEYELSLQQLHAAAEAGGTARYPADFAQGFHMRVDYLQSLRAGARLLALEAHVRAHQGDAHGAARSVHAMFMLADSLRKEPLMMSQLVRSALDSMTIQLLRDFLPDVYFSNEDLQQLQAHLGAVDYKEGLQRSMLAERVMGVREIRDPSSFGGEAEAVGWRPQVIRNGGLARYLETMEQVVDATKQPWPVALQEARRANRQLGSAAAGSTLAKVESAMAGFVAPALEVAFVVAARNTILDQAAGVAIAVERYRRENGKLPERLEELVPKFLSEVPLDPYDGQPLRYVAREAEYIIYSIGRDRTDNGGRCNEILKPDIAFSVKLREAKPRSDP